MEIMQLHKFMNTLTDATSNIKVLNLEYKGQGVNGSEWVATVEQIIKPWKDFYNRSTVNRIICLEFNGNYLSKNNIPYCEEVFLQAYFRKYILDNFYQQGDYNHESIKH